MKSNMTRWVVTGADAPVLVFESTGGGCTLREMWNRTDSAAYVFPGERPTWEETRGTVITLTAVRAD
jgi:hypothetical protein